jgi:hypothetical protein
MKEFLLKAILQPFVAILFCLGFGLPFAYFGFQTVNLEDNKDRREGSRRRHRTVGMASVHFSLSESQLIEFLLI